MSKDGGLLFNPRTWWRTYSNSFWYWELNAENFCTASNYTVYFKCCTVCVLVPLHSMYACCDARIPGPDRQQTAGLLIVLTLGGQFCWMRSYLTYWWRSRNHQKPRLENAMSISDVIYCCDVLLLTLVWEWLVKRMWGKYELNIVIEFAFSFPVFAFEVTFWLENWT